MAEAQRKDFAHQHLILKVNGHPLVKMTHVLYKIRFSKVYRETRLVKIARELNSLNASSEG